MKRDERRQAIMDLLVEQGAVDLDDLAHRFVVSKMTIHRDLDDLEAAGVLRKIRGGATIDAGTQFESDFRFRERQGGAAKAVMAHAALELIEPGMTVMINDGSTAAVLGALLPQRRPLTVITNNSAIIDTLKGESGISLITLGGAYSAKFNGFFGVLCEENLRRLRSDISFLSVPAVSGTQVFHMDDDVVRSKRAMMDAATKTCLLVNHARFDRTAMHLFADLSEFDAVITDAAPSDQALDALSAHEISLTIANPDENPA
ncbi:DeoR/GlpR family DNA-binding transcription regulator [Actibacterium lipolyticum]|uniref:DeoR/GlpR family DNA-binding transcription regulator n=1 Tax=Actibacterium lipolyticum TaxID=1524263 RepID=UPI000B9466BD|nr:DeoR/GlpR family DNA-binding transcription regulator [Actibacterium lipolyticum]